jgi:ADP-ribose pyrophosphatase
VNDDALQILKHETIYQGFARLDLYRLRHRLYSGAWSAEMEREIFERGATVGVLLYDPDLDAVVLVTQFRLPPRLAGFPAWQLEIVAGIIDHAGESVAEVATRETKEEAGLTVVGELERVHRYMPSPGACTETVDLFCGRVDARNAGGIHGLAHENEDIKVVVLPYREAMRQLRDDKIQNGLTALALYWLGANRAKLRRKWKKSAPVPDSTVAGPAQT